HPLGPGEEAGGIAPAGVPLRPVHGTAPALSPDGKACGAGRRPSPAGPEAPQRDARAQPPALPGDAAMLADVREVYDAEVAEADLRVGMLLAALRESGMFDDAIVVITADHGEEFEEHGGRLHGNTLYEELIHVPLVIRPPGGGRHLGVDEPVELI